MERWFCCIILPLLSLGMNLLCWRAVFRQGWVGVMPMLSRFVIFSSVSFLILLPVHFWTMFPGSLQPLACKIYLRGYETLTMAYSLLAFAVVIEAAKHTFGQSAQARRTFTTVVTSALCALIVLIACVYIARRGAPDYSGLEKTLFLITRIVNLATILAAPVFFSVKRWRSLKLEGSLTVIVIAIAVYPLLDLVFSFIYRDKGGESSKLALQILGLVFFGVLYGALLRGLKLASAASSR